MSVKPFSISVVVISRFLINSNADVHFIVDNKAKVDFANVIKSALIKPVKLVEFIPVIILEKKLFDILVKVYLFHLLELKYSHFKDTDCHVPLNFLLVR